jgi:hypothetical protein
VRLSLEAESAKWFGRSLISGGVVAFGCLLEVWETAVSLRNWFRARRGLEVKENPKSWGIPIAALGLLLVVGGIVAEVAYEGLASNADARLRAHESDVLSAAETNAGEANERAGNAEERAAQLSKDVEAEHLARVRIEAGVQWRHLSKAQEDGMSKRLRLLRSTVAVTVWFSAGDAEGSGFAADIAGMLREANLRVLPPRTLQPPGPENGTFNDPIGHWETGVEVESTDDPPSVALADAIINELEHGGFNVEKIQSDAPASLVKQFGPNVILGVVSRPNGPQGEAKLRDAKKANNGK